MNASTELSWFHTLTLAERAAFLAPTTDRTTTTERDLDTDLERRWRQLPPFADDSTFARRLESEQLDTRSLRAALGLKAEDASGTEPPSWVETLDAALNAGHPNEDVPIDDLDRALESAQFLALVTPLVLHGFVTLRQRLARMMASGPLQHFDPNAVARLLTPALPGRLAMLIRRVLILELNIARLEQGLDGDTPERRFASFIDRLGQRDEQRRIFVEYPVMTRQVLLRIDQWRDTSLEFVRHLAEDWSALEAQWAPAGGLGQLIEAKASLGDSHRGGHSVMRVAFDSGVRLIYKPRSLDAEVRFNHLLGWLNNAGFTPAFRTLTVLDRSDHGWVEMVEIKPCRTAAEVERFYQRQGAMIALLYALNASDIHYENILAAGEHPVLVDLETLFLPRITNQPAGSPLTFMEAMKRSVLAPGLLPQQARLSEGEGVSDLSGMTEIADQKAWAPMLMPVDQGTDQMRFERLFVGVPSGDNTPSFEDQRQVASDHTAAIEAGFTRLYRLMANNKTGLLADDGPIVAFENTEMRLVFRPTRVYASLLFESFHPDVMRDALERDLLLDNLWQAVDEGPFMVPLLRAEKRDLLNVDVPIFTARAGSTTVRDSRGEPVDGVIGDPGLAVVRQIIKGLDERDFVRQRWLVRASLAALDLATGGTVRRPSQPVKSGPPADNDHLLTVADAAAAELAALAYTDEHRASWYAFELLEHPHWGLQFADPGLYEGLAGIALYLGYHGALRDDDTATRLARGAVETVLRARDEVLERTVFVGAFAGRAGLIYTLLHLGQLWQDSALVDEAEALVPDLMPLIEQDTTHDIVGGAAGCLVTLLDLAQLRPSDAIEAAIRACGEHLLAAAQPQAQGVAWPLPVAGPAPLAGFSHGAAGIAWALLRLHAHGGDARYRDTALAALDYERSLFDPTEGNWPDLREGERPEGGRATDDHHFLVAWCHGAPGILLARLLSLPFHDDPALRREIEAALTTTLEHGFDGGHCLCHGALGNLDILLVASDVLDRPDLREEARRRARGVLQHQAATGWHYGVPGSLTPPGLMTGLAGFGYQMLRLAYSESVPSVLALAPPPSG